MKYPKMGAATSATMKVASPEILTQVIPLLQSEMRPVEMVPEYLALAVMTVIHSVVMGAVVLEH
jgi:hypothetical protein